MAKALDLTIVVPARNEEASLPRLHTKLVAVLNKLHKSYEIILVDDGSTDRTFQVCNTLRVKDPHVKVISFRKRYTKRVGKSDALQAGFDLAKGKIVISMDADLQDDPAEIPNFINKLNDGYDMVSGWKKKRFDPLAKKIPSKLGNWLARKLTNSTIHDMNCGFKAYKLEVVKSLNLYGELYKFIPVLAQQNDFRVGEIVVKHHPRRFGKSKFSWERNAKGFLDLITIFFLSSYLKKPGHFFGALGLSAFGGGFVIGLYITYLRVTTGTIQYRQPLLFLGMLLMIIGVQLMSTGLLAEMLASFTHTKDRKPQYRVLE